MPLVFAVLRRGGEYAVSKPARETLFNVLPPDQKYKAKNVIDTLVIGSHCDIVVCRRVDAWAKCQQDATFRALAR